MRSVVIPLIVLMSGGVALAAAGPEKSAVAEPPAGGPQKPLLPPWGPVKIQGTKLSTGTRGAAELVTSASYSGQRLAIPVLMVRGHQPGPTVCLTGGTHGDELNGIETVRRVLARLDPDRLSGMVVGLPVVNLHGFRRGERDLPDRRDLNRHFPGRRKGSAASRVAYRVFTFLEQWCDQAIDFHTGSARRSNFPQVRVDTEHLPSLELAFRMTPPMIVHSNGSDGMLRRALNEIGLAAVTYEAGEAMRFQLDVIEGVVHDVTTSLADRSGRFTLPPYPDELPEVILQSRWIRVDRGGILTNRVQLGDSVEKGQILGVVQSPFDETSYEIVATRSGLVIGLSEPQLVLPGFPAYHVGFDPTESIPVDETDDPAAEHSEGEEL